jgi:hypothetical protein
MFFLTEIENCLSQIARLEQSFREVKEADILPLTFFSRTVELLNELKHRIFELESVQLQIMSAHLQQSEERLNDTLEVTVQAAVGETFETQKQPSNKPAADAVQNSADVHQALGDAIIKKIYADLNRSLSINQRFMFCRDIFRGSSEKMNEALNQLNTFQTITEAVNYLDSEFNISWDTESGAAFRELLEKRFA